MPVAEDLGQDGLLAKLPGDNPVGGEVGSSTAVPVPTTAVNVPVPATTVVKVPAVSTPVQQSTMVTIYVTKVITKTSAPTNCRS